MIINEINRRVVRLRHKCKKEYSRVVLCRLF